jgi:hypothetical protein
MSGQPPNTRLVLLSEAGANADGDAKEWSGSGPGTLHVFGTFSSQTVTLYGSTDGGVTWTAYSTTYSAATITSFEAGNILVKAGVSNGGTPSITVHLVPQDRA